MTVFEMLFCTILLFFKSLISANTSWQGCQIVNVYVSESVVMFLSEFNFKKICFCPKFKIINGVHTASDSVARISDFF